MLKLKDKVYLTANIYAYIIGKKEKRLDKLTKKKLDTITAMKYYTKFHQIQKFIQLNYKEIAGETNRILQAIETAKVKFAELSAEKKDVIETGKQIKILDDYTIEKIDNGINLRIKNYFKDKETNENKERTSEILQFLSFTTACVYIVDKMLFNALLDRKKENTINELVDIVNDTANNIINTTF